MESINDWTAQWAQAKHIPHHYLPEIESTNSWAKAEFKSHLQNAVFLADHQTHGRGRGSHQWTNTQPGHTWMATWCFALSATPHPLLNMRIGYALFAAVSNIWPNLKISLKVPNDLYLHDGKLAGILTEIVSGETTIMYVGIGLNVFSKPVLAEQTTSALSEHTNLSKGSWFQFCDALFLRLRELSQDTFRTQLLASEQNELLEALKCYPRNAITTIDPDGSLHLSDGRICHWNEL